VKRMNMPGRHWRRQQRAAMPKWEKTEPEIPVDVLAERTRKYCQSGKRTRQ